MQRIENMDSIVEIVDAIKDADFRFEAEDYNGALAIYQKARKKHCLFHLLASHRLKQK